MNTFFWSDPHFGHHNIIKYSKRPFLFDPSKGFVNDNLDAQTMDRTLIKNHNAVVSPHDKSYCLGDFAFHKDQGKTREIIAQLNGTKVLILGNHDTYLTDRTLGMFSNVYSYLEITVDDKELGKHLVALFHYPLRSWNKSHFGSYSLYGHHHGSLKDDPNSLSFDVGVDAHGYTPISFHKVKEIMSKKTFVPIKRDR